MKPTYNLFRIIKRKRKKSKEKEKKKERKSRSRGPQNCVLELVM